MTLGTWQIFFSKKGAPLHRTMGTIYLALMAITAIAALFIHTSPTGGFWGFSPIHLFVPLTLWGVVATVFAVRRHDIKGHRNSMLGVYIGGLGIAGTLAFLRPGGVMNAVMFGG